MKEFELTGRDYLEDELFKAKALGDRRLAWIRTMNDRRVSMGLSCISCNLRPKSNYKDGYVDRHTSNCELAKEIK